MGSHDNAKHDLVVMLQIYEEVIWDGCLLFSIVLQDDKKVWCIACRGSAFVTDALTL